MSNGQVNGDSILMNESSLARPLILHNHQFRSSLNYGFNILKNEYIGKNKQELIANGKAGLGHDLAINLKYGIIESLEVSLDLSYVYRDIRHDNVVLFEDGEVYEILSVDQKRGWRDPFLSISYMLPFSKKIDLIFSGISSIPISEFGNVEPSHTIENLGNTFGGTYYKLFYENNEKAGFGTWIFGLSGIFKYRFNDQFALTIGVKYLVPQGVSENKKWSYYMSSDMAFHYEYTSFETQIADYMEMFVKAEYQMFPFFNLYAQYMGQRRSNGWSENEGLKLKTLDKKLGSVQIGYEIIATHRLWLNQRVDISIAGENNLAPVVINTQFVYNLFFK